MKRPKKIINWIVVVYLAGVVFSWTAEFWRDVFKSPVAAWTALDALPSGRDFIWPVTGVKRIFSASVSEKGDGYVLSDERYRAAQLIAEKGRAPTGMTLTERESAAFLFEEAARIARKVDPTVLRSMHGELPTHYRYQYIEALALFATALRQNDAVLWKVAENQMAAYDAWRKEALPEPKP